MIKNQNDIKNTEKESKKSKLVQNTKFLLQKYKRYKV